MLSLVDACLGRLPGPAAASTRPFLRLLRAPLSLPCRRRLSVQYVQQLERAAAPRTQRMYGALPAAAEDFFAGESVTFSSLGLDPDVCSALQAAGLTRPAQAQELAAPAILSGRDVVLAAETGSGKTLAYLAPLASLALRSRRSRAASVAAEAEKAAAAAGDGGEPAAAPRRRRRATAALVLCPNAALCEQVAAAAAVLRDPASGAPLAVAAVVSAHSPPPPEMPDVVVATPGGLVSLLDGAGAAHGLEWTRAGLPTWARRVVLDEADLLLSGGYGAQMRIVWDALRAGDRTHAGRRVCLQAGLSEAELGELPRHLKLAAAKGGAEGLLAAGFRPRGGAPPPPADAARAAQLEQEEEVGDGEVAARVAAGVLGPSWRRQYVFVAATLPAEGESSVGAELAARFPDALWLAGRQLHQSKRAVSHDWRRVEGGAQRDAALREVVAGDALLAAGAGRVLVFARDVASAEATADALEAAAASDGAPPRLAAPVLRYHKGVPAERRAAALAALAAGGAVMVCTDAAARGLDVPDVTHVVQADFASSAVDFLHRVGRTGRAGRGGRVTSLYGPEAEPLVAAIRDNIAAGLPVEGAFSRKRSFRKKLRKYGEYVPRGQEGPAAPRQQRKAELAARAEQRRRWR